MIAPTITSPSLPSFALRLRSLRRSKGLTQEDVAVLTGYSKRAIETWEERTSVPKERVQFAILQSVRSAKSKKRVKRLSEKILMKAYEETAKRGIVMRKETKK